MLWLIAQIIDGSNPQEEIVNYFPGDDLFTPGERRRGIPIGNQTSQFFSNVYLDLVGRKTRTPCRAFFLFRYNNALKGCHGAPKTSHLWELKTSHFESHAV